MIQSVGVLALLIFLLATTLVSLYAGNRGWYRKLRRIPILEVINEAVGRAAEMGRGVIFSTGSGSGGLNSDSASYHLAGLNTLGYVANLAATGFYARQWQAKYRTTIMSVPTAVNFSYFFPLYQAGSVKAILNGSRGCAEYEQLIGSPGMANQGIDALSMGQLVVIGFMLLGNVAFIGDRLRRRGS